MFFLVILTYKTTPHKLYFSHISSATKVCTILKIVLQVDGDQDLHICIVIFLNWGSWKLKIQNNAENNASFFLFKEDKIKNIK